MPESACFCSNGQLMYGYITVSPSGQSNKVSADLQDCFAEPVPASLQH